VRPEVHIADILSELERQQMLPAIVFRTARAQCDTDVQHAHTARDLHLPPTRQHELREMVLKVAAQYEMEEELITTHPQYLSLIKTGVGAHHAGQLLGWRLMLEELMSAGMLRVLVATGTVAAGVDFPARTVVITAHSKRGAEGFANLTPSEFQQMSGRAGRRGKDTVGFCLAAPAPFCDARTILKIAKRPPERLVSQYFPAPSTVLNLLRWRNVDDLRFTVERSLAAFYDRKEALRLNEEADKVLLQVPSGLRDKMREALTFLDGEPTGFSREQKKTLKRIRRTKRTAVELENRQQSLLETALSGLRSLGYLEGDTLSKKGYWAAQLCTTYVLELAEIVEAGLFDGASAETLVAIIASFCGDEHRSYLEEKNSPLTKEQIGKLDQIFKRVQSFNMPGVIPTLKVIPNAAVTAVTWMHAKDWQEFRGLMILKGVAEGDAARLITQTAEQLNQLVRLSETHPQIALRAEEAKRRIMRPPLSDGIALDG
jgi:superfamily II RNA helicase